jgi:hypothetical protein
VKRYVRETGSRRLRHLVAGQPVATSRLSEVEVASGLARRARERALTKADRDRALAGLLADFDAFIVVELTPAVTTEARALLLRHPLRTGDAIQLASCRVLSDALRVTVPLVAFDDRLRSAAAAEGLPVLP